MTEIGRESAAALKAGAQTAVHTCMAVGPEDGVFVITDQATSTIGAALLEEARQVTPRVQMVNLEQYGQRPFTDVPVGLKRDLEQFAPSVTFFAAQGQKGEIPFRINLRVDVIRPLNARHGHMINIDARCMAEGMAVDYNQIAVVTWKVTGIVKAARTIRVTSPKGTDLVAQFDPKLHWVACHGLYHHPGDWGNLPEGETYTSPASADGVLVVEVLGDYFSKKYGILKNPVTIRVKDGFITGIACADRAIQDDLTQYFDSAENGRRMGEYAIGTNIGLHALSGNLLQDEKIPGLHVAFGNPYPEYTGATWNSTIHCDVIPTECTISVDGRQIMRAGQFDPQLLA